MTDKQLQGWGIALIRWMVAIAFLMHGGQKIFVYGFGGVTASFANMGIPAPSITGVIVPLVEFGCGLALLAGAFTRWAAALLAIDMLGAVALVHLRNGFFLPGGFEYALTMLVLSVALVLTGPGELAIDRC